MDPIKKARLLSWITVVYNILEGVVSIFAGIIAGSIALWGFGLDSFVESLSGFIMVWRFSGKNSSLTEEIEGKAEKMIGVTFFILGFYILYESVSKLVRFEKPEPTLFGIAIAVISIITMPVLYYFKMNTGKALGSKSLIADAKETLACIMLSVSLLTGLGLNWLWGLWWADPAAGIVIVIFLLKEGREIFSGGCSCDDTE